MLKIVVAAMAMLPCFAFAEDQMSDTNIAAPLEKVRDLAYDGPYMETAVGTLSWPVVVCAMNRSCVRNNGKRAVFFRGENPEVESAAAKLQTELQINGGPVKVTVDGWGTDTLTMKMFPANRPDLYVEKRMLLKKSGSDIWADHVVITQRNGCAASAECWPKQKLAHQR